MTRQNPLGGILGEPATPETCAKDYGTPGERAARAAEARVQAGLARAHSEYATRLRAIAGVR